jgi:hypothetical protein
LALKLFKVADAHGIPEAKIALGQPYYARYSYKKEILDLDLSIFWCIKALECGGGANSMLKGYTDSLVACRKKLNLPENM